MKKFMKIDTEELLELLTVALRAPNIEPNYEDKTINFEDGSEILTEEQILDADLNSLQGQMDIIQPVVDHYLDQLELEGVDQDSYALLQKAIFSLIGVSLKVGTVYGTIQGTKLTLSGNTIIKGDLSHGDLSKIGAQWYGAKKNESTRSSAIRWAVEQLEENPDLSNNRLAAIIVAESSDPDKFGRTVKFGTARDYARAARQEKESSNST